jgi:hypothetical protein
VFEIEARRRLSLASETHDALLAAKMRMLAAEFSKRSRQKNCVEFPQRSWVRVPLSDALKQNG